MNRARVEGLLRDALGEIALDLDAAISANLGLRDPAPSLDVIALGKGAAAMVDRIADARTALVVLPDDARAPSHPANARVLFASHPLPDARSVAAGEAALDVALHGSAGELCVLVSGGASSLAFAPIDGVSLDDARALFDTLLRSGADVRAMNVVRRHVSRVHGGGLAQSARRPVTTLVVSDVIGGATHDVGSGPACADPTTTEDARDALRRFAPRFASIALRETLKPRDAAHVRCAIALEPRRLGDVLAQRLRREGLDVCVLPPSLAPVEALAAEYVALARSLAPGRGLVRSAEPSLRVTASGPGGRCTHLAALVARDLPPGVTFVAAASDGVDGASGTAGAVVDSTSFPDLASLGHALATFATGPLHVAAGTALAAGPTGVNLTDVHALVRA